MLAKRPLTVGSLFAGIQSAASTSASNAPACELCGNASRTPTASASSQSTGPTCLCTPTSGKSQPLRKLTPQQLAESIRLYQAGLSLAKVAEQMGVSRQAMHDLLKRRIELRDRVEALPRKEPTAIREKRRKALKRYRSQAARITTAQVEAVKARDRTCRMCGGEGTDIDHILPVGKGGQTEMDNLQLLCNPCHRKKTGDDWRGVSKEEVSSTSSESTCSVEASRSRAKTSPTPEPEPGSTGHARVFGPSTQGSFANYDPATSSWKTSQLSLLEEWAEYSQTWPRAGMTRNGTAYRLAPSAPLTGGIESGSLPTPTTQDAHNNGGPSQYERNSLPLNALVRIAPPMSNADSVSVTPAGERWATPTAWLGRRPSQATGDPERWHNPERSNELSDQVAATGTPGALNPTFVEWLQGFPKGWTEID